MRILCVLAMLAAATIMPARVRAESAAPSAVGLERLSAFFDNEANSGRIPGAVVLVQQHGSPVYLRSFGFQDVTTRVPMAPDTIFALHSMTKPITCLAAMMLIDEGRLAPSGPVSKYIPSFAGVTFGVASEAADGEPVLKLVPPDRPMTVEDLLRQTSGITYGYIGGELIEEAYRDAHIFAGHFDNREFAHRISRLALARQPGPLWRYGHSTDIV